jgi:ABC-type amino acid transport system permease subunit
MSKRPWLHWPAVAYIELVRGTPILLTLFLVYFGLPRFGIRLPSIPAAVIAFSLNGGAFMAEIIRSGIQSIDRGQFEAADALGLGWARAMTRIVAPQAIYVILPPVVNFGVELLKLTSIALVIAVPEVTFYAYNAIAETFRTFELLALAALVYIVVSVPLSQAVHVLEKRLGARR